MKEDKYSQGVIVAVDTLERLVPKLQKFLEQKRTQEAQRCLTKIIYSATRAQHLLDTRDVQIIRSTGIEAVGSGSAALRVRSRLLNEPDFVLHDEEDV